MSNNSPKSFKKFLILWSGQLVSAIGSGLTSFGLGVYVYEQTKSASATAIVTLFAFMPSLLLSSFAGVLADRYDRRLLMILGDGLSALGLVFILVCMLDGNAQVWQICIGVTISSIFSSLLEPAYKATITDLLTKEQFTRASALVQIAGSAKYLISPIIAGFLLVFSNIQVIIVIDILTLAVTILSTFAVRSALPSKIHTESKSFLQEFKEGWIAISKDKGVLKLVLITSVITFFLGFIQTLLIPMILAFSNSSTLGVIETISALGLLVTSILIGVLQLKKDYVKVLSVSMFFTGIFMIFLGSNENIILIGISGFLFFATLPFTNTCLDFLIRTNIDNSVQGRAWGLIGVISQLGYVVAYAISGVLADYVFTPLLTNNGALVNTVGKIIGTGNGRGIGFLIIIAGISVCLTSFIIYNNKSIKKLDNKLHHSI